MQGRALRAGDRLALGAVVPCEPCRLPAHRLPRHEGGIAAHVVLGPQHDRFTARGIEAFLASTYAMLPQSDRMGARLRGECIEHAAGHDIVSDGTALGAIQVPGDGQPIVLLVDRQSTGGYTKIATVCSFDIGRIAQLRPGQSVRFVPVSVAQAHAMLAAERADLATLTLEKLT
jgi:allophanate hydrolase subunit 2